MSNLQDIAYFIDPTGFQFLIFRKYNQFGSSVARWHGLELEGATKSDLFTAIKTVLLVKGL